MSMIEDDLATDEGFEAAGLFFGASWSRIPKSFRSGTGNVAGCATRVDFKNQPTTSIYII
jgi:hypothetical protein